MIFEVLDIHEDRTIVMMDIFRSPQTAAVVTALVVLMTYIFTKLYQARSLIWDRQRKGLVRDVLTVSHGFHIIRTNQA